MVNGITFSEQLITSENFAHFMYTFLNHANGVTKGCAISNANGKVYVQKGYFIVFGRMVQIIGTEEITSPDVVSGQLYCKVVFEVDLSKENTAEEFIQGAFKTLTSTTGYPSVKQEDLDDAGKVYQMPWCQYIKQAGSIKDFRDLREILDLNSIWSAISGQNTQYKGEFDDYFAAQRSTILGMIAELEGHGYATTAEFNDLSAEVADTKKSVSDGKALVAAAITAKRVATAATDTFAKMAENIKKIVLGSGNALKAHVLAGKTFTNDDGVEYTGEMPERAGEQIPASQVTKSGNAIVMKSSRNGHINETTTVAADQSAVASAAGVNGAVIRAGYDVLGVPGQIQSLAGADITPQTYAQTIAAAGKYGAGNHNIRGVPLPPANVIKKGYRYWIGSNYVDGQFEGYVPMPTDLYLRGQSFVSFSAWGNYQYPAFDSGQITCIKENNGFKANVDFTGFTTLNFEIYPTYKGSSRHFNIQVVGDVTRWAQVVLDGTINTMQTVSINLGVLAINQEFAFTFTGFKGAIYRIWKS